MSTLVLELRQGDMMVVNGAPIRFRNRARIELAARARFLFGKQILAPEEARTPARRVYFAIQCAYVCEAPDRPGHIAAARRLANEYAEATTSNIARTILAEAIELLEQDRCWEAMRAVRELFAHDDAVLTPGALPALDAG